MNNESKALLDEGRVADALAVLGTLPKELLDGYMKQRLSALENRILYRGRTKMTAAMTRAKEMAKQGDLDEEISQAQQ